RRLLLARKGDRGHEPEADEECWFHGGLCLRPGAAERLGDCRKSTPQEAQSHCPPVPVPDADGGHSRPDPDTSSGRCFSVFFCVFLWLKYVQCSSVAVFAAVRHRLAIFVLLIALLAAGSPAAVVGQPPPRRPNVLLIMADDLNNDLGAF